MKRYDHFCSYDGGGPAEPQESPDGEWVRWEEVQAALAAPAPTSDSFVQEVPDKCDRIVWRGRYLHLPLAAPAPQPESRCSLGCTSTCKARDHGRPSECPWLPWQPAAPAPQPEHTKVYLVATGETHDGEETYTRHDVRPPLCDAEVLYVAAQSPAPSAVPAPQPEHVSVPKQHSRPMQWVFESIEAGNYGSYQDAWNDLLTAACAENQSPSVADRKPLTLDQIGDLEFGHAGVSLAWDQRVTIVRAAERAHGITPEGKQP